jgi:hypothetical protein
MQSLRGVSLPDGDVYDLLATRFVVGMRNIERASHVGLSHGYACDQTAVGTTNGAGGRNLQLVVLAPDETVLHVLPGFWHPEDLVAELGLALEVHRLHGDAALPAARRDAMFAALHRSHLARQTPESLARADWQDFDLWEEVERSRREPRDTVRLDAHGQAVPGKHGAPALKPVVQVVHERMLARPFRKLADFDMESFVDYGRPFYDNNWGIDEGRKFHRAVEANKKRDRAKAKAAKAAKAGKAAKTGPA